MAFYLRKKSGQFLLIFDNKDNLWGNGGKSAKFVFGVCIWCQTPNTDTKYKKTLNTKIKRDCPF
jgi:hypothetical protein